jgi:hypothetical protein
MLLTINNSVMYNILKLIGMLDTDINNFHYSIEIKYNASESDFIYFCVYLEHSDNFIVFSKTKVSINDIEKLELDKNDKFDILLESEYIQKIILLIKWYPKNILFISLDFNVISISINNDIYKIMYSFDSLEITEPILLRHTCIVETEPLKKIFEICLIKEQCILLEINNDKLFISNEHKTIKCVIDILDSKKIKFCISLRPEYINFIINRLVTMRSKSCMLYINKGLPFVIEDTETGDRIYTAPKE